MRFLLWVDGSLISFLLFSLHFVQHWWVFWVLFGPVLVNFFSSFLGISCLCGLVVRTLHSGMEETRVRFPVGAFFLRFFCDGSFFLLCVIGVLFCSDGFSGFCLGRCLWVGSFGTFYIFKITLLIPNVFPFNIFLCSIPSFRPLIMILPIFPTLWRFVCWLRFRWALSLFLVVLGRFQPFVYFLREKRDCVFFYAYPSSSLL